MSAFARVHGAGVPGVLIVAGDTRPRAIRTSMVDGWASMQKRSWVRPSSLLKGCCGGCAQCQPGCSLERCHRRMDVTVRAEGK